MNADDFGSKRTHPDNELLLMWLGQAGFMLRTARTTLLIDPYLSNAAEEFAGLRRSIDPVIDVAATRPDAVLVSHPHVDHLDPPTIRALAATTNATLVGSDATARAAKLWGGFPGERVTTLAVGESVTIGDADVTATFCRHSDFDPFTEESIGYTVGLAGIRIWHPGDSEYDHRLRRVADDGAIDVALVPINGTGGNMNAHEAALLAWQLSAELVVPMHFGMWTDTGYTYDGLEPWATLDPATFVTTYQRLGGVGTVLVPTPGELVRVKRTATNEIELLRRGQPE